MAVSAFQLDVLYLFGKIPTQEMVDDGVVAVTSSVVVTFVTAVVTCSDEVADTPGLVFFFLTVNPAN